MKRIVIVLLVLFSLSGVEAKSRVDLVDITCSCHCAELSFFEVENVLLDLEISEDFLKQNTQSNSIDFQKTFKAAVKTEEEKQKFCADKSIETTFENEYANHESDAKIKKNIEKRGIKCQGYSPEKAWSFFRNISL